MTQEYKNTPVDQNRVHGQTNTFTQFMTKKHYSSVSKEVLSINGAGSIGYPRGGKKTP